MKTDFADWTDGATRHYDPVLAESLPWHGISVFLEGVLGETTTRGLAEAVLVSVDSLIPHDFAVFLIADARDLAHPRLLVHHRADETLLKDYLDHFIHLDPTLSLLPGAERFEVDWGKYSTSEFTLDFMSRMGMPVAIGIGDIHLDGDSGFVLVLYRSGGNGFATDEKLILAALQPHLHNLSSGLLDPFQFRNGTTSSLPPSLGLTPREGEIALLLRSRPTVAEIAEKLTISRKTAAKHLESIYLKLGVDGKRQAAERLFH